MVSVSEAEKIILSEKRDYGTELVPFEQAMHRVLAKDIATDRDLPPCNRVTMDGIAIRYAAFERGTRSFKITATIAAGMAPTDISNDEECVAIMTGSALPSSTDTMIRYEDVAITNNIATILTDAVKKGQNIHLKGKDKKQNDIVVKAGNIIDPALISMAASVGCTMLDVKKLPRVIIITTGDELVMPDQAPTPYQIRSSNSFTLKATLQQYAVEADLLHLPDDLDLTRNKIKDCLQQYDVLLMCGGVSMGKFDYVPQALEDAGVTRLFHKVQQRPGKPFWFGKNEQGVLVFAFPGNPVSAFLCLHRYFIPWLFLESKVDCLKSKVYAVLDTDVTFNAPMQYFMQVKVPLNELGQLTATPIEGNGSGDFANLLDSDAFMELPMEQNEFKKGEVYPVWPFKKII